MQQRSHEQRVIVLAPVANDANAIATVLRGRGFDVEACREPAHCQALIAEGAGVFLLTEESLEMPDASIVFTSLKAQPAWSELPVVILTSGGTARLSRLLSLTAALSGSVTLLERPISTHLLVRAVEVALNARRRQYHMRQLLEDLQQRQRDLEDARRNVQRELEERKAAERALRESEELFRALAENVPQLAWMTRPDGWITWYNRRWFDYTGTNLAEMQGWGWQKVHHPEHVERVTRLFRKALAEETPWEDTFPLRGRDGHYRWFLSRAFPIRNAGGAITHWFGTNTDITALRETQDALRAAEARIQQYAGQLERTVSERTAKLQDTVQELEAFSYSLAHDMRGPLRSMIGYSDLLREEHSAGLDDTGRHYLGRIHACALRLDRLIQDVLSYSRVSRDNLPLEPVDLRQFLEEILESYPNLTAARRCIQLTTSVPPVVANRAALAQLLSNLLENAVKFVAPGVEPCIRIGAEPSPTPGSSAAQPGWLRVWVQDNGIGIPAAAQPRLFQMFQRANRPGLYEGTGMGLAIARKAVERMGGTIGVDSSPGKGSRFWFVLRLAEPAGGAQPAAAPRESSSDS